MAGRGSRFSQTNFDVPKPLINILDKPMIEWAVKSIGLEGNYIFITRQYENSDYNKELNEILFRLQPNCQIITINHVTDGAACTALLAEQYMWTNQPLLISDCDLALFWNPQGFINFVNKFPHLDAVSLVYNTDRPQNSYVEIDENFHAKRYAEKQVISKWSTNGVHWWRQTNHFINAAKSMIKKNLRVNNEFYISPTFNELIENGYKISVFPLEPGQHFSLGSPEDIETFKKAYHTPLL